MRHRAVNATLRPHAMKGGYDDDMGGIRRMILARPERVRGFRPGLTWAIAAQFAVMPVMTFRASSVQAQTVTCCSTYVTQPTTVNGGATPPANSAADIPYGTSIAVGVDAHASSPSNAGDSIAIGSGVNATNQDSIAIGAQTFATGINTIAIGNGGPGVGGPNGLQTVASGTNSLVFGVNALSSGYGSIAIGNGTTASPFGGIALGYLSQSTRAGMNGASEAFSHTAVASPFGDLSIGVPGFERQITNVAGGTQDTDAINVRQLRGAGNDLAGSLGGGAGYDSSNVYTAPTFAVGGVTYHTVASALSATNNLSVQYTPDGSGNPTNAIDLTKGNTLAPVALTGLAPATTSSGAVALSQLPLQYSTSGAPTTANPATPSNDVTLIGTGGQPVTLHNVAAGALTSTSTDAVNGSQLYTTNQNVADLRGSLASGTIGLVQQDASSRTLTVGGATDGTVVDFANGGGTARTLTNVAGGQIASNSTQAVNGGQVYGVANSTASALGGGSTVNPDGTVSAPSYHVQGGAYSDVGSALGIIDTAVNNINTNGTKYVGVNSSGTPAQATGLDAAAIGPNSVAAADGSVALGANSTASRTGLNGAREDFSGTTVGSTEGAVSVGATGAERQITNVAGGTQDTDAVNVRQLRGVGNNLATSLGGGAGYDASTDAYTAPSYSVNGTAYNNVGGAVAALDNSGVKYDVDPSTGTRRNSVTLQGGDPNQPVLIHNVAAGQAPTDAANTGQVVQAKADAYAYTDRSVAQVESQIGNLNGQISDLQTQVAQVRTAAAQSAAIGLAAASLRYDDQPGKLSSSVGTGFWQGQTALAMGLGYSLPNGRARVNANAVSAGHDFGFGAGASFTLN